MIHTTLGKVAKTAYGRLSEYLWLQTIRNHYSRMGWVNAPRYSAYLKKARATYISNDGHISAEIPETSYFKSNGFTSQWNHDNQALAISLLEKVQAEERLFGMDSVWNDDLRYSRGDILQKFPEVEALFKGKLGILIENIFQANFKIYYGLMYKSIRTRDYPEGSQLWHSDSGPGTCINLMFCLNETDMHNGAMEFIPWEDSLRLFAGERRYKDRLKSQSLMSRIEKRSVICDYYDNIIKSELSSKVVRLTGQSGLVLAFRNNVVHRGGFPDPGHVRYVCIFHVYPSATVTPWSEYRANGISKIGPYPVNPAF